MSVSVVEKPPPDLHPRVLSTGHCIMHYLHQHSHEPLRNPIGLWVLRGAGSDLKSPLPCKLPPVTGVVAGPVVVRDAVWDAVDVEAVLQLVLQAEHRVLLERARIMLKTLESFIFGDEHARKTVRFAYNTKLFCNLDNRASRY